MAVLNQAQKDQFWKDGVLVVENAVTPEQLAALRGAMAEWIEESRSHDKDYGEPSMAARALTCNPVTARKRRAYAGCSRLKKLLTCSLW